MHRATVLGQVRNSTTGKLLPKSRLVNFGPCCTDLGNDLVSERLDLTIVGIAALRPYERLARGRTKYSPPGLGDVRAGLRTAAGQLALD